MKPVTKLGAALAAVLFACFSVGAAAASSGFATGLQVLGTDGEPVGTIEEVQDDAVVVNTGTHRAPISKRSVDRSGNALRINATRSQIDDMIAEQRRHEASRRDEYLAPGRLVRSVDREAVGRIVAIENEADSVVILRNEGVIALKRDHFAVIEDRLVALFTRQQIDQNTKPVPDALRQRLAGLSGS
ncbi:hypothetical protein J3454_03800 [Erythrobacter sp. NFXS35]|uniref:hypothetical protein n=1 Tax=Erythrobacter sp. NFXS35 TaxID=2818436 RepID=UPI0032DEF7EA